MSIPLFWHTDAVGEGRPPHRKGITGLAALEQEVLRQDPASSAVFAFRGRRGDRLRILYWDGQGFCLYYKVLERGRFPWPSPADGTVWLTSAQLAMLWEGIDWRRPACASSAAPRGVNSFELITQTKVSSLRKFVVPTIS